MGIIKRHIILDVQHIGKPGKEDFGASADMDKDGKIKLYETEAEYTRRLTQHVSTKAFRYGLNTIVFSYGNYSKRHEIANNIAKTNPDDRFFYFALHFNAPLTSGFYGLVAHDSRSSVGKALADSFSNKLVQFFPHLTKCKVEAVGPFSTEYQKNLWNTFAGIYKGPNNICGVCIEPSFVADSTVLSDAGLDALAECIIESCDGT